MTNIVNISGGNIEALRREADGYAEIFEALADTRHSDNPRADHIARYVDQLGENYLDGTSIGPWARERQMDRMGDIKSLFNWLYLRLIGQDKMLPMRDAWVQHPDQRGAIPLHPTCVMPWQIEARFIDPLGTGTYAITIERLDDEGDGE